MKSLDRALENLKYDSRMVDWNIQNGLITKVELEKHLNDLKDLSHQTQKLNLKEESDYQSDNSDDN
ncbi:MAG: hypothetical protein H6625_10335 [Bdellovibrionaceae bacterium]|nr:hypothetical protein [Pseudobdellovibrionaceae bacterium]